MTEPKTRSANPTPFILPFLAYMVIASFYPDFAENFITSEAWLLIIGVIVQVIVASGLLIYFWKIYTEHFPLKVSWLSVVVGAVGVVLWIGVCRLNIEPRLWGLLGFDASRPSFDPFTINDSSERMLFLVFRLTLMAAIVPLIEELFLRGWLVRWYEDPDFEHVSLKGLPMKALLVASVYGVVTHPNEAIAAFLWFGLVTWLMNRTGNLWDCVVAHATTNLLLAIYILKTGHWHLW